MNHRQQLFANAYLRHGDPLIAYSEAYKPKEPNYRSIMSAANRLLRNPEIAEHINAVRDAARAAAEHELKEKMKEELLSVHDKRLYIKRVINGEVLIPQDYKANGCNRCTMFLRPTFPQVLAYLKEDSRLAGHYPEQQTRSRKQPTTIDNKICKPDIESPPQGIGGLLAKDSRQQLTTNHPHRPTPFRTPACESCCTNNATSQAECYSQSQHSSHPQQINYRIFIAPQIRDNENNT